MEITNEDLLKEISEEQLIELSDLDGAYALNQAVINDAIDDAISFIKSFIVIPDDPTPLLLKIGVDLAICNLKQKNDLITDEDKETRARAENYLSRMAKGSMPTTVADQDSGAKRDRSFAFRTSTRKLERREI